VDSLGSDEVVLGLVPTVKRGGEKAELEGD
jgi:hypothetical protein